MTDDLFIQSQGAGSVSQSVRSVTTVNSINRATTSNLNFDPTLIFGFLIGGTIGFLLVYLFFKFGFGIIRAQIFERNKLKNWKEKVFLEITVPKETAEQLQKEMGSSGNKEAKESLAVGEQLFSVMSDFAKGGFKNWLMGSESFSFEIVTINQQIYFWVVCSKTTVMIIEKQILSIYPKAHIVRMNKVEFFKKDTVSYAQELTLDVRHELPLKTYKLMDTDPLNPITSALSGLEKDESAAIQLIITPVKNKSWQRAAHTIALKIQQGQNPRDILFPKFNFFKEFGKAIGYVFKTLRGEKKDETKSEKEERTIDLTGKKQQIQLTPQQQEIIKKLEEKSSKSGFKFTLRIVGAASNAQKAEHIVNNIVPAFQIYDFRPSFNSFKKAKTNVKKSVLNFILRSPNLNQKYVINNEEINSIWHLPGYMVQTSAIKWLLARRPPIPLEISSTPGEDRVYIGKSVSRGVTKDIYLEKEDRFRHIYSLGGSGSGKTVTMLNIALQDIEQGRGCCIIDPHGEGVDDIMRRIPPERIDDVILFSPSITDRPLGLNMLETNPLKPTEKTLVIDTLFNIWDKLYDLKKTGGPMFESYMKNSMRLVMSHPESGSTLMEIPKVLSDEDFRAFKLSMCEEQEVVDFWEKEATKAGGEASLENMVPYITSKLAPFVTNDFIRPMIGQQHSVINFREAMDNNKIILVSLSKGLIGENSAYLVGMVIIGNMLMAGMGRSDGLRYNLDGTTTPVSPQERTPFFVYIDEMQNFLFDSIPKALEEIRKYKVGFYLAHQFVKQVVVDGSERIKDSLMANCATKIIYRCSADDAKYLEAEFAPLTAQDIANPERFTFNTICLVKGQRTTPFNVGAWYPEYMALEGKDEESKAKMAKAEQQRRDIIEMVKMKYGRPREEIEKEIRDRGKLLF